MIVISSSIVLADGEGTENPVIGYRNIVTISNVDADTEATGYPATNVANPATQPPWKATTTSGTEYLTVTTGTVDDIDYLAIAGHNFGTAQCTVSVEVCNNIASSPQTWTEVAGPLIPGDDAPLLFRWTADSYQGVRLKIVAGATAPQAAVLYVGKLLVLERSIKVDTDHTPITMGRVSKIATGRSENGKYLGRIVLGQWNESAAAFSYFTPSWFRSDFVPFIEASDETPFFFAWHPSEYPLEVGYVWLTDDPRPGVDPVTQRINCNLKYQGIVA